MLTKYIDANWKIVSSFDSDTKLAAYVPEPYTPPEVTNFIDNLNPDPRFAYFRTIAMSDGDTFGSNLNGDIFSWDQLMGLQEPEEAAKNPGDMKGIAVPRYKTFEQSHFFKHHANGPHDRAYGDVALAVANEPMRCIELIIRVAKQDMALPDGRQCYAAPDIVLRLEQGDTICVSMGTKIEHERCTICGNTNRFVRDRCPHLRNQINEILPDGRLVAATNHGVRFFDISKVTVPADPIAMDYGKVASVVATPNLCIDCVDVKSSMIRKNTPAVCLTDGVSASMDAGFKPKTSDEEPKALSSETLQKAASASRGSLSQALSMFAVDGVILTPLELAKLAYFCGYSATEAIPEIQIDLSVEPFKAAERSGFDLPVYARGYEATDCDELNELHAAYRAAICSADLEVFQKTAMTLSSTPDNLYQALHNLAFSGAPLTDGGAP